MNKITKNEDLNLTLQLNGYVINPNKIKLIDIVIYTDNVYDNIRKTHEDVDVYNSLLITSKELALLNDGVIKYNIQVVENDGTIYADIVTTDYVLEKNEGATSIYDEFVTKDEIGNYVTKDELNSKNYLTEHQDISHLANKSDIPTKTSQLTNDSNYLTSHQSLAGYATEQYVNQQIDAKITAGTEVNLDNYYKKSETYSQQEIDNKGYLTQHQSLADYALKSEIPSVEGLATVGLVNSKADKTELVTKLDTSVYTEDKKTFATKTDLTSYQVKGNYLTTIPTNYVTDEKLAEKGYLTAHQSLDHLATKTDLTSYQVKGNYVTNEALAQKGYLTEHQSLYGYAKESWVNEQINAKITGSTEVDLTDYYKKNETYSKNEIDNKGYLTTIPEEYVTDTELTSKGYLTEHQSLTDYALKSEIPNTDNFITNQTLNEKGYLTAVPEEYVTDSELIAKGYLTEHQSLVDYALKSEIPSIDGLATVESVNLKADKTELDKKVDTSGYTADKATFATKTDLTSYQVKGNYVTNEALAQKGYLTEHQKIKTINNQSIIGVGNITIEGGGDVSGKLNVSDYEKDKATFATLDDIPAQYLVDIVREPSSNRVQFRKNNSVMTLAPETQTRLQDGEFEFLTINNTPIFAYGQGQNVGEIGNINIYTKEEIDGLIGNVNTKINEIKNMI